MDHGDIERDARLFRPPSWRPWVVSGVLTGLVALPVGFVGLLIGSDEALAAKPFFGAAGLMIVAAFVLLFVGLAQAARR